MVKPDATHVSAHGKAIRYEASRRTARVKIVKKTTAPTDAVAEVATAAVKTAVEIAENNNDMFIVNPTCAAVVGSDKKIPFYRPTSGHELKKEATFAVRCNENYADIAAAFEWERAYVRAALLRCKSIFFYRCSAKNPIIIMKGFEAESISTNGVRAADAAKKRTIVIRPKTEVTQHKLAIEINPLYRITGPTAQIEEFIKLPVATGEDVCATVKPHHVAGLSIAHAFLNLSQVAHLKRTVCVELLSNILTSEKQNQQMTIRGETSSLAKIAMDLQKLGAFSSLRTHGTLRVTMPKAVDTKLVNEIKIKYGVKVFTDTPVNVWSAGRPESDVQNQVPEGKKLVKVAADYMPHPAEFKAVAAHLKGTLHSVRPSKFTDKPMACLVLVDSSFDLSQWEKSAHAFFGPGGLWYITTVGTPDV